MFQFDSKIRQLYFKCAKQINNRMCSTREATKNENKGAPGREPKNESKGAPGREPKHENKGALGRQPKNGHKGGLSIPMLNHYTPQRTSLWQVVVRA